MRTSRYRHETSVSVVSRDVVEPADHGAERADLADRLLATPELGDASLENFGASDPPILLATERAADAADDAVVHAAPMPLSSEF